MEFRIPEPCPEPWEHMQPRPDGRHCRRCDRTVVDFSVMTRARAEAVARGLKGPVCGRVAIDRRTGEPWFRPPEAAIAPRWAGGVVLAAALTAAGCGTREAARSTPVAITEAEPLGEPLSPIDPEAAPDEPRIETRAVPLAELSLPADPAEPTAEQRRLTAHKRARQAATVAPQYPPHVYPMDGGIGF